MVYDFNIEVKMNLCKNKISNKYFIIISEIKADHIKTVTPVGQIKIIQQSLFENIVDGNANIFLKNGKITDLQYKMYMNYIRMGKVETTPFSDTSLPKQGSISTRIEDNITFSDTNQKHKEGQPMKTIKIDEEVYAILLRKTNSFEEKPNDVLRRLLGIKEKISEKPSGIIDGPQKAPKANLSTLVEMGVLHENQKLTLNYKNETLSQEYHAIIIRNRLKFEGALYTMSKLVAEILDREEKGIPSKAYRGPEHWHTSDGVSIKNLWKRYRS